MTPVLCLISDRRRCGPAWERALIERVASAARAGVHLVQVRERDLEARALLRLVSSCLEAVRGTAARVIVNDRLDVALAAGADGVHLRGDSISGAAARRIAPPGFLIGRSVHTVAEAADPLLVESLDYLIFGTVFESRSKAGVVPAGVDRLAAVAAATVVPVLAVGGVSAAVAPAIAGAGACGVAAIGAFWDSPVDGLPDLVRRLSVAFDSPTGVT